MGTGHCREGSWWSLSEAIARGQEPRAGWGPGSCPRLWVRVPCHVWTGRRPLPVCRAAGGARRVGRGAGLGTVRGLSVTAKCRSTVQLRHSPGTGHGGRAVALPAAGRGAGAQMPQMCRMGQRKRGGPLSLWRCGKPLAVEVRPGDVYGHVKGPCQLCRAQHDVLCPPGTASGIFSLRRTPPGVCSEGPPSSVSPSECPLSTLDRCLAARSALCSALEDPTLAPITAHRSPQAVPTSSRRGREGSAGSNSLQNAPCLDQSQTHAVDGWTDGWMDG